jgi:hypothetical protein
MREKDLLIQLNKLNTIKADADFKATNRQLLMAQIAQGEEVSSLGSLARLNIFMSRLFQPYAIAAMIVLFFAVSSVWGMNMSAKAKPGDSLYIAKKLSERTKMLMAVNDKSKAKLNLEFASNRVAEMSSLNQAEEASAKESLKNEFKSEISQVKTRLAKLNNGQDKNTVNSSQDNFNMADKSKDGVKIDIAVPDKKIATTTADNQDGIGEVLEEAEKLFDSGSYEKAAGKLDEANKKLEEK